MEVVAHWRPLAEDDGGTEPAVDFTERTFVLLFVLVLLRFTHTGVRVCAVNQ